MMTFLKSLFTENINFKLVSLFIAVILWVTILGRRDFVYSRSLMIDAKISENLQVRKSHDEIRIRLSGTRTALKKFMDSDQYSSVVVDLRDKPAGVHDVELSSDLIRVPLGVKILSIRPPVVRFEIESKP